MTKIMKNFLDMNLLLLFFAFWLVQMQNFVAGTDVIFVDT